MLPERTNTCVRPAACRASRLVSPAVLHRLLNRCIADINLLQLTCSCGDNLFAFDSALLLTLLTVTLYYSGYYQPLGYVPCGRMGHPARPDRQQNLGRSPKRGPSHGYSCQRSRPCTTVAALIYCRTWPAYRRWQKCDSMWTCSSAYILQLGLHTWMDGIERQPCLICIALPWQVYKGRHCTWSPASPQYRLGLSRLASRPPPCQRPAESLHLLQVISVGHPTLCCLVLSCYIGLSVE